ncbi:hypothetical protein B0O80DRAFT_218373 [Mortierella sp. GBAus27b]|nr:hypothetical protein B0O80DRAFT_218373 [Mortierella sp. GBAus27b]
MERRNNGERSPVSASNEKLEATLTRVMKNNEITIAELEYQLKEKEALLHSTAGDWEKKIAQLTAEREAAEQAMQDAQAKAEDMSKNASRAEKSKFAFRRAEELVGEQLNHLTQKYEELQHVCKEKDNVIASQRKEKEDYKRLYDKVKTRSLVQDIEKISSLTEQLRNGESRLAKSRATNDEKEGMLAQLKTKIQRLQDEKNEELNQLGRLQEELASKDLELSDARSTCAGAEAAAKMAKRERDAAVQRLSQEGEIYKQKLSFEQSTVSERDNEIEFLKAAVASWETKYSEQSSRLQKELDLAKEKDNLMAMYKATIDIHEAEIASLKENQQRLASEPIQEHYHGVIGTEPETVMNEEEMMSDLTRALTRLVMLEEVIEELEQDAGQAKSIHEQATAASEELRRANQDMQQDIEQKKEKISTLEKLLEKRKQEFQEKCDELVNCKSRLSEQELKVGVFEEEQKSLRHQIALLEKLNAEQQVQVEGREKALKRREEARKLYDKVYESKIESLKDEMAAVERIAQGEWQRIRERHEIQINRTMERYQEALDQSQRNLETARDAQKGDMMVLQVERDELKRRLAESEDGLQKNVREIEARNMLLAGYMALVNQQQDDGILAPGSETFMEILDRRRNDLLTIQNQADHIQSVEATLDDTRKIVAQYSQNMSVMTTRNETLIRQSQDRDVELATEKKARVKEQAHLKSLLKAKEDAIQVLETELREKTDAHRRTEAALLKYTQTIISPVVPHSAPSSS